MGFDIDQLSDVLNALTAADIPFIQRSSRHTSRSFLGGENASFSGPHYVYVHKNDFERAQAALQRHRLD